MQLEKNNIHMNRIKARANMQFTVDEDINVPENKCDIEKIICNKSNVILENVNYNEKKVKITGKCEYSILYGCGDGKPGLENLSGMVDFQEILNMDEGDSDDNIKCQAMVEDMKVRVINSRKISIKAVINLFVAMENVYDEEIACGVSDEELKSKKERMDYASIALNGTDLFRIKEDFELPRNKPDVNRILWKDVELRGREIRLLSGGFSLKGELAVFLLYDTYEDGGIQWHETAIPFSGKIDYPGMSEDMISDIVLNLASNKVELKTNSDGEDRLISVEAELSMDIRVYEERNMDYLVDLYSLKENVVPLRTQARYEQLLVKNSAKCRVIDKVKMKASDSRILQICGVEGSAHIDDIQSVPEGILVEGALIVNIIYVTIDDNSPVAMVESAIPFSQTIEVMGAEGAEMVYTVRPNLEQLTATVLGNDEIEVRAIVNLDAMVLKQIAAEFITGTQVEEELPQVREFPGLIGYIANSEEALWDIAKKYRTSVEKIQKINNMNTENLRKGEKILVIR